MNDMDEQLKRALRRSDPSEGFADRVLMLLAQQRTEALGRERSWNLWPRLRWATALAVLVLVVTGIAYRVRERRDEEREARAAKQQVMLALRITGSKLRIAKQKVKAVEGGEAKMENTL
jgi:hypothetical protein